MKDTHTASTTPETHAKSILYLDAPILKKKSNGTPAGAICITAFALAAMLSLGIERPAEITAHVVAALNLSVTAQDTEKARQKSSSPIIAELDGTRAGQRPDPSAQGL